jgi:predicted XRE-type DNA-binding protein
MTNNVFLDLGFEEEEAAGLRLRSFLFMALQQAIKKSGMTQKKISEIIGTDQPKISKIINGKFSEFSTDRIAFFLDRLGYDIEISATPRAEKTKLKKPGL